MNCWESHSREHHTGPLRHSALVLVSCCCCNKLPQPWWLKQRKFIMSPFWRSKLGNELHWAEIKVSAGLHSFLEALREGESIPPHFQLLEAAGNHWQHSQQWQVESFSYGNNPLSSSVITSPSLTLTWLLSLSSTFKDPCDSRGLHRKIRYNLLM